MRLPSIVLLAAILIARPEPGAAQAPAEAAIARLRATYVAAYDRGDAGAMVPLYAEDAVRMPYDAVEQVGCDAIVAGYRTTFAKRAFDPALRLVPASVRVAGDQAVERGAYVEVLTPKAGGRTLVERGKYVAVVIRTADGSWRYLWSIFNRDGPAKPKPTGSSSG
jgi:uncharacterized protein (TIGR02246 family)